MPEPQKDLIAVDVGNSFIKFGRFQGVDSQSLPKPIDVVECIKDDIPALLGDWLPQQNCDWLVSSVNREMESALATWVASQRSDRYTLLTSRDVPIAVDVEFPERVGMDRLAAAVTANRLRQPNQAVIVIDAGSAITVDVLGAQGAFLGGAILPGLMMSASVLASNTDLLPLVPASYRDSPPPALGRSTEAAMRSGLYWGTVGAIKELVHKLAGQIGGDTTVIISGGTAELLKDRLPFGTRYVPQLVLSGIALIALTRNSHSERFES